MKRLRGILGILLIFGLGLTVGLFLGFAAGWIGFFHKVVKGGPAGVREVLYQRAKDDLKLDYAQKEELREILKETSKELDAVTASVRPAVEKVLGTAEKRIVALLTTEQKEKFEGFLKEAKRKWGTLVLAPSEPAGPSRAPMVLEQ